MSKFIVPADVRKRANTNSQINDLIRRFHAMHDAQAERDADAPRVFGVGGASAYGRPQPRRISAASPGCDWPPTIPGCFGPDNQRLCDMQKVSVGVIVQGGAIWNVQVEPTNSAWFDPKAVRMTVRDAENTDLEHSLLVTTVTVNDSPVGATNVTTPAVPALVNNTQFAGFFSDDWQDPDTYAVGVSWPVFSDLNNKQPLRIGGLALGLPATTFAVATISLYGNAANNAPPQ